MPCHICSVCLDLSPPLTSPSLAHLPSVWICEVEQFSSKRNCNNEIFRFWINFSNGIYFDSVLSLVPFCTCDNIHNSGFTYATSNKSFQPLNPQCTDNNIVIFVKGLLFVVGVRPGYRLHEPMAAVAFSHFRNWSGRKWYMRYSILRKGCAAWYFNRCGNPFSQFNKSH